MTIIEQIKAEIERLKGIGGIVPLDNREQKTGYESALIDMETFLSTLESEKPMNKDCNDCPHCVDRKDQYGWHFKGCFGGPYNGKFIAEIDECPLRKEQPEVDLEKASRNVYESWMGGTMDDVRRDMVELGKVLNARKEENK